MDSAQAAREIVSSAASRICLDMRFLTAAVLSLRTEMADGEGRPFCDGRRVVFHADTVLSMYREDPNSVARDLAHCVMHCILGHDSPSDGDRALAEDMIVEYVLDTLDAPSTSIDGRDDRLFACGKVFSKVAAPTPDLVAQAVSETSRWQLDMYRRIFTRDDHSCRQKDDGTWEEMSKQAMVELEGFSRNLAGRSDALLSILRIRNARRYDYRSFLRRFMTRRTRVRESRDEFDPIYYTYGLSVYGNLPLIDSLEVSDSRRIEEFVIAVDTSGSTMGEPVKRFLEEAFEVLRQSGLGNGVNLHIIQCDDEVRSDDVIRGEGDLRRLMAGFRLKGGGGTDFRPVFAYVDQLISEGRFRDLRGLMYFTDGFGTFPSKRPPYDTAFVFCDDSYREHEVPPWAMKIVIRTEDLVGGPHRI